jgi:thioesterase domain-containing protein
MRDSLPDFEAGLQMVLSTAGPLGELGERMIADLGPHILQLELKAFYEKAGDLPAEERLAEVSRIVRRKLSLFSDLPAVLISRQIDLIVRHDSWLLQFEPSEFRGELILLQPEEGLGYPSDAWRTYARGPIRIEHTPGNHFGMLAPPHVSALAKKLRFHLEMDDLEFCC